MTARPEWPKGNELVGTWQVKEAKGVTGDTILKFWVLSPIQLEAIKVSGAGEWHELIYESKSLKLKHKSNHQP